MPFFAFKKQAPTGDGGAHGAGTSTPTVREPTDLGEVLASILGALAAANRAVDTATAELAKIYWKDPVLRTLRLPSFTIPEVTVHLKFAVADLQPSTGAARPSSLRVLVDAQTLGKLAPNLVSEIELKVSPQMVRTYEADTGEVRLSQT